MSVDRRTNSVSCHKSTCQGHMMFVHCICLYKVETITGTTSGQLFATDKYLNRRFWRVEQDKSNLIILVFMLSLFRSN